MQRASKAGLHKRFYEKHRERIIEVKKEYGKLKRREDPTFGLWQRISQARKRGDIGELAEECFNAIARLDEISRKRRCKPKNG